MNKKNIYKNKLVETAISNGIPGPRARMTVERMGLDVTFHPGYGWVPFHKSPDAQAGITIRVGSRDKRGKVTSLTDDVRVKEYPVPAYF